jgi:hypothetical protein
MGFFVLILFQSVHKFAIPEGHNSGHKQINKNCTPICLPNSVFTASSEDEHLVPI